MADNLEQTLISNALQAEASKRCIDGSAGLLADRSNVHITADGTVLGCAEAIDSLLELKPGLAKPAPQPAQQPQRPSTDARTNLNQLGREQMQARVDAWHQKYGGGTPSADLDVVYGEPENRDNQQHQSDQKRLRDFQDRWR